MDSRVKTVGIKLLWFPVREAYVLSDQRRSESTGKPMMQQQFLFALGIVHEPRMYLASAPTCGRRVTTFWFLNIMGMGSLLAQS